MLTLKLGIGDVSIDLIIAQTDCFRLHSVDLLRIFADLIEVVSGERFDRKYFTGVSDVALDVPTVELEVVCFVINVRVEEATAEIDTGDVQRLSRNCIVVNLSETGEAVTAVARSVEAVQLADEQERVQTVVVEAVVEHKAEVARVVLNVIAFAVGIAYDNRTGFGNHLTRFELTRSVLADVLLDVARYELDVIDEVAAVVTVVLNDCIDIFEGHSDVRGLHLVVRLSIGADTFELFITHRGDLVLSSVNIDERCDTPAGQGDFDFTFNLIVFAELLYRTDACEVAIFDSVEVNLRQTSESFNSVVGSFEVIRFAQEQVRTDLLDVVDRVEQETVVADASEADCACDNRVVFAVDDLVDAVDVKLFHSFYLTFVIVDFVVAVVAAVVVVDDVDDVFHFVYLHFSETFLLRLLHIRLISY